jgi:hypothetical protein
MAVAGSTTTAYYFQIVDGVLEQKHTTTLWEKCMGLDAAEKAVKQGKRVIVAGGDAYALRLRLNGAGNE